MNIASAIYMMFNAYDKDFDRMIAKINSARTMAGYHDITTMRAILACLRDDLDGILSRLPEGTAPDKEEGENDAGE